MNIEFEFANSGAELTVTSVLHHALILVEHDGIDAAILDHALWFHRPFRADDWLLYSQDSPSAYGARGFCRGSLFTQDGRLVASVAQEGLMRPQPPKNQA